METAEIIKKGIKEIPELYVLDVPFWVISFASIKLNIYKIMDEMGRKNLSLNGLYKPTAIHIAVTWSITDPCIAE